MFLDIIHLLVIYLKHTKFRRLDSVSVYKGSVCISWVQLSTLQGEDRIQSPKLCVL
jgi:hypothetical protein